MPQTREHLAIVRLLGVPRLVVALTKSDLVEEEWLELAADDVRETLLETPYGDAPILPVSSVSGQGVVPLLEALELLSGQAREKDRDDLARLPIDRVFTIRGSGTIVTGTLWTGSLGVGDRVRVLPGDQEARIRSVQLHNQEVKEARAGARIALGLTGSGVHHETLFRGQSLVEGEGWEESWMLTCHVSVLPDTGWILEQGQRVRVHIGTAEVLARVALLETEILGGGEEGWVQLRLEEPVLARGRDHLVLRSYSPVTTIGGGVAVEVRPPKRRSLKGELPRLLEKRLGGCQDALDALLEDRDWAGVSEVILPHLLGFPPWEVGEAMKKLHEEGRVFEAESHIFPKGVLARGEEKVMATLSSFHEAEPLQPGMPLEELRQIFPPYSGPGLGDGIIQGLTARGALSLEGGSVRLSSFRPSLTSAQEETRRRLRKALETAGLSPPGLEELARDVEGEVRVREVESILRFMESEGEVLGLEGGLFFWKSEVRAGGERVVAALGGSSGLGPTDFREILGVTRKYLLPLLRYMDTAGVTTRFGDERTVATTLPGGWEHPDPGERKKEKGK